MDSKGVFKVAEIKQIPFGADVRALMKGTSVTSANPPTAVWFGAFEDGVLVGCCCAVVLKNTARLKSLVVLDSHRGKGLGRELWDFRMSWVFARRIKKLTGFASPYSQGMYLKAGFKLKRRIPRGVRGETWFMEMKA